MHRHRLASEFQFQYGSIKRQLAISADYRHIRFQFQYGSIKSRDNGYVANHSIVFQFQYGSIKRTEGKETQQQQE